MQVRDVAAVQNSLDRAWEISFAAPGKDGRPSVLPAFIDSAVENWLERKFAHTAGYGPGPAKTRNRSIIHQERFRAIFRRPLEEIHIYDPEGFSGQQLGAALARISTLRAFSFEQEGSYNTSEADWISLCADLRSLPNLEAITLGGTWLTDATIAPLAGHPRLKSVTFLNGQLTTACAKTLAALPNLRELHIEGQRYDGDTWLMPEQDRALRDALPAVNVDIP